MLQFHNIPAPPEDDKSSVLVDTRPYTRQAAYISVFNRKKRLFAGIDLSGSGVRVLGQPAEHEAFFVLRRARPNSREALVI